MSDNAWETGLQQEGRFDQSIGSGVGSWSRWVSAWAPRSRNRHRRRTRTGQCRRRATRWSRRRVRGYYWEPGHWQWNGHRYVWIAGRSVGWRTAWPLGRRSLALEWPPLRLGPGALGLTSRAREQVSASSITTGTWSDGCGSGALLPVGSRATPGARPASAIAARGRSADRSRAARRRPGSPRRCRPRRAGAPRGPRRSGHARAGGDSGHGSPVAPARHWASRRLAPNPRRSGRH